MPYSCRPTWVDVDLAALLHNLNQAASFCVEGQRILAVVKADAYGHGAVHVTQTLQTAGIQDFAVATLEEALDIRRAGIFDRLLVLGGCFPGQEQAFIDYDLMPSLFDADSAERLNKVAGAAGTKIKVHLKVDSGMGRVGFLPEQLHIFLPQLRQLKNLTVEGFMSHLACADDLSSALTSVQRKRFSEMLGMLRDNGIEPRDIHLNNSAGLSGWDSSGCTLFRPGIMLYGGLPGHDFAERLDLKPVMHLRSSIAQLRTLPAGSGVSYGHTYHAAREMMVAVLPIGYADGYNRLLSNQAEGILHGRKIPQVGRVCMDWIMFDVTDVPGVAVGDQVTLLGAADGLVILGDDWAEQLGTISYEIFCRLGQRLPRRYLREK